jgi:hypothetical protein
MVGIMCKEVVTAYFEIYAGIFTEDTGEWPVSTPSFESGTSWILVTSVST